MRTPSEHYYEFQEAYEIFNRELFDAMLPNCLFTLQRKANSKGYYCREQFRVSDGEEIDEIALNPKYFVLKSERGVLSTLVHEATHLWQFHFGESSTRGYHNKQWSKKMKEIGLYPSSTGKQGGTEIGYRVSHYIIEGGRFDIVCTELLKSGFRIPWFDNPEKLELTEIDLVPLTAISVRTQTDSSNRWKYTCPVCKSNAWAKPKFGLICAECEAPMPKNDNPKRG